MKKKSRQNSPDDPAAAGTPAEKNAGGPSSDPGGADPAAEKAPQTSASAPPPAEPRRSLPAFGFASDLLKKRPAEEPAAPAAEAAAPLPASPLPASPLPAPASPATFSPETFVTEKVDRDHLQGNVAERDLVEGMAAGELERSFSGGLLGPQNEGPNRIFDFADRLAARAEERKSTGPKPRLETCLKFSLGGETFAMPVEPVQQIVRISSITRVPHAPRPIRGVTNLRGRVIPVIDLRVRVGLPAAEIDRSSRIIAVGSRGRVIGLLVDAVHQVMHLDLNQIQRPPEDVLTLQSDYIAGVYHLGESLILLLDVDRALIVRDSSAA